MKLVLIPGLDGTGDLFAPFVATLGDVAYQVIAYPPSRDESRRLALIGGLDGPASHRGR